MVWVNVDLGSSELWEESAGDPGTSWQLTECEGFGLPLVGTILGLGQARDEPLDRIDAPGNRRWN
ncbi:MAG TPA: hypothetical protein VFV87_16355 [Pirellulaceae bacterium]|nr:hypothetical protein [Pirellulaceae bacterium]